jgi:hypothetical protein
MTGRTPTASAEAREQVRETLVAALTTPAVLTGVASLADDDGVCAAQLPLLPDEVTTPLSEELAAEPGWVTECWARTSSSRARQVTPEQFLAEPPTHRTVNIDNLREPCWPPLLRGVVAGLADLRVAAAFSAAYGEPVELRSQDVARYRQRQYLRRHSDTFERRRFGLVLFLSSGWELGHGGELVVEPPSGESVVLAPRAGGLAMLRISPGWMHHVSPVRSADWVRYSVAAHYGLVGGDPG